MRRFLCDNALQWLRDYRVDGRRIDAVHALPDRSPTHLLEQLRQEADALARETGRARVLVAGGWGLDAQWNDDFHHALHERIGHLVPPARQRVAAGLVLLSPFIPMLFQGRGVGRELSLPLLHRPRGSGPRRGGPRGAPARAPSPRRRPEDVPDPQALETFERSRLDWKKREREPHSGLLEWHRRLIRLRRERSELCDGRLDRVRVRFDERERWMCVARGRVTIGCNLGARTRRLSLEEPRHAKLLLASAPEVRIARAALELPPDSLAVLASEGGAD